MEPIDYHRRLGDLLKNRRTELGLTLENVTTKIQDQGHKLSPQYLSNIETAYSRSGNKPATPPDDMLAAIARALTLPIRDLHAALGRVPAGSPAVQLVRGELAAYEAEDYLNPAELDDLSSEIEDFARVRVQRLLRQFQSQCGGKQFQRQGS